MHLWRPSSNVPRLPSLLGNATKPWRFADFWQGAQSLAPAMRKHIWTSKSAPYSVPVSFLHFWLGHVLRATTVCTFSASQLLRVVRTPSVLNIWLRNVLRATTACTFSTSQLPKVVRTPVVFNILTWKCASRHNGVCFVPQRRALFRHLNY